MNFNEINNGPLREMFVHGEENAGRLKVREEEERGGRVSFVGSQKQQQQQQQHSTHPVCQLNNSLHAQKACTHIRFPVILFPTQNGDGLGMRDGESLQFMSM